MNKKTLTIPKSQLISLKCPRCKGEQEDPASQPYFREFHCTLCKGGGSIWMINPEFYLGKWLQMNNPEDIYQLGHVYCDYCNKTLKVGLKDDNYVSILTKDNIRVIFCSNKCKDLFFGNTHYSDVYYAYYPHAKK